jgi:hypothetical protein
VCDHIEPAQSEEGYFDETWLRTMYKRHHDKKTATIDRATLATRGVWDFADDKPRQPGSGPMPKLPPKGYGFA